MICSPRLLPSLDHLIEYPAISLKCLFDVTPGLITSLPELRLLKAKRISEVAKCYKRTGATARALDIVTRQRYCSATDAN
jgi:hypothetical protein